MKIDTYTKFILTVIAIALVIIALHPIIIPISHPSPVYAQFELKPIPSPSPLTSWPTDQDGNPMGSYVNPMYMYIVNERRR